MSKRRQAVKLRSSDREPQPYHVNPHPYVPHPNPPDRSFSLPMGIKCRFCGMYEDGPLHLVIVRPRPRWNDDPTLRPAAD